MKACHVSYFIICATAANSGKIKKKNSGKWTLVARLGITKAWDGAEDNFFGLEMLLLPLDG